MTYSKTKLVASAMVIGLAGTMTPAAAINLGGSAKQFRKVQTSFIAERGPALAPMGHVVFCMKNPGECRTPVLRRVARVDMTPNRLAALADVNSRVNRSIAFRSDDASQVLRDQWQVAVKTGDCEDYALAKRRALIAQGWPASALRVAVGRTRTSGEGHAVLVVKTNAGDFVLDNRTSRIQPWTSADIDISSIQSGNNPRYWSRT